MATRRSYAARGIPTDYLEHPPSPIYDERFTRIDGISAATSRAIADELRSAGFVGADGLLTTDGDVIAAQVAANPAAFPVFAAQAGSFREIRSEIKTMRAEHAMYADATARTIRFFDRFVAPPSAPFGSWVGLVTRLTTDLTGKPPTTNDLNAQVSALEHGAMTKGDVVAELRGGADNTGNVDPVARLYRAAFGRTPDAGGLHYWVDLRRSRTVSLVRTADLFASSREFIHTYGLLTNRQFVTRLYANVLGRSPDQGGLNYWTRQLDQRHLSRGGVLVGFSESAEYKIKQRVNTDVAVVSTFLLGRSPSSGEVADWATRRAEGETTSDLATAFLDGEDYARHVID